MEEPTLQIWLKLVQGPRRTKTRRDGQTITTNNTTMDEYDKAILVKFEICI